MAAEQQERESAAAGSRSDLPHRSGNEAMPRGAADGASRGGPVRVPGRGISRGAGFHPGGTEGNRERDRYDEDDPANQRPVASADPDPEEQAREGAGELHRSSGSDRRQRSGVRAGPRMDEDLLRTAGDAEGSQEGDSAGDREHVRVHREGHRAAGRASHTAEQPQGTGEAESRVHDGGHRHRRRDMLSVHGAAGVDERVSGAGAERPERRSEVAVVPVRVHRRDGEGLHLCGDPTVGGCVDGSGPGAQADSRFSREAHGAGSGGAWVRGRPDPPAELPVAQHLRDIAPRDQCGDGGHRRHAGGVGAHHPVELLPAGAIPSREESEGSVLEDLQFSVYRCPGWSGGRVPGVGRRRGQRLQQAGVKNVHLSPDPQSVRRIGKDEQYIFLHLEMRVGLESVPGALSPLSEFWFLQKRHLRCSA